MLLFNENTIECCRKNFSEMLLSDPIFIGLYQVASNFDDETFCPTMYGNLFAFIDVKSDEWLQVIWDRYSEEDGTDTGLSVKEKCECFRAKLIEELKDVILDDITY